MGTTFVAAEGELGFWMNDGILELFLRLAALHVQDEQDPTALANVIRNKWILASRGSFSGWVPHCLDEFASSREGRAIVTDAIDGLMASLRDVRDPITPGFLRIIGIDGRWVAPVETSDLLEVCESMLKLLDGEIGAPANDTSFMPGSRHR